MAEDAQPRVTAADVRLPATVVAIPRLAVTAAARRMVADRHMVADRRTAAVVADMGGNT